MASIGFDGLASGLATTSLIDQLMQAEAAPQRALKTRVSRATSIVTALQGINARVASLATSAAELAKPAAFAAMKATSSGAAATATASSSSSSGSLSFEVKSLATAHSVLTDVVTDPRDGSTPSLSINGVAVDTGTSWDPQSIATAINAAGAGVSAAAVKVADGSYRLKISADDTGAAGSFTLGGSLAPADPAAAVLVQGKDAQISLGATTTITSATNTFTGLMPGVDVTVAALTGAGGPVTVTVAKDTAATTTKLSGVISALGVALSDIADRTRASTDGTSGVLVSDSGMRLLRSALTDAASGFAGGAPLSQIGVELKRDGTVTFDQGKLTALMQSDPSKAQAMVTDLADRLATAAKSASDPSTGSISRALTSQRDAVKDLNERITSWDARLEVRRSTLKQQFDAMETALSGMRSQSSWLSSALAGLPGS